MDSNTTELCCPLYQCGESRRDMGPGQKGLLGPVCATGPFTEPPSQDTDVITLFQSSSCFHYKSPISAS